MDAFTELSHLLRPAGGGLYLVSTGRAAQLELQQRLYGARDEAEVQARFLANLERITSARVVILGSPSDVGAGFLRGANLGPQAIRTTLLAEDPRFFADAEARGVIDLGDVFVVPQLLHDEMLSEAQLARSRRALYGHLPDEVASRLPVSPLSIAERALDLVFALNPSVRPFVLGGDHSNAWPVAAALARARAGERWAVVQPDAHTDLLEERLGVRYCFATWSYHANELLGRDGRMVQVGTRASRHDRGHWEGTLGVRQFWGEDCRNRPEETVEAILEHLRSLGVTGIYFSNDIDGTDEQYGDATGTPEAGGVTPDFLVGLLRRLADELPIIAGDLMEVAPPLVRRPGGAEQTLALAARYTRETLAAMLR